MITLRNEADKSHAYWRSVGVWLTVAASVYSFVNVLRAIIDPGSFSAYLGLPLAGDTSWVLVYASRTAVIAAIAIVLVLQRNLRSLALFATLASIMPVSDAILTAHADAGPAVVLRHVAITLFLLVTAALVERQYRKSRTSP